MVEVVSRTALTSAETHDAWVSVFAAVTAAPPDERRAACPNCGHFAVRFQYVAEPASRVGFCALWCDNCRHGHVLARTRVPPELPFLALDAAQEDLRAAIPPFREVVGAEALVAYEPGLLRALDELRPSRSHRLSPREREVAALVSKGAGPGDIALQLEVSPATVRSHLHRIYWKLGRDTSRASSGVPLE